MTKKEYILPISINFVEFINDLEIMEYINDTHIKSASIDYNDGIINIVVKKHERTNINIESNLSIDFKDFIPFIMNSLNDIINLDITNNMHKYITNVLVHNIENTMICDLVIEELPF